MAGANNFNPGNSNKKKLLGAVAASSTLRLRYRRIVDELYIEWVNRRGGVVAHRKAWDTEIALIEQIEYLKAVVRAERGLGPAPAQIDTGLKRLTNLRGVKVR